MLDTTTQQALQRVVTLGNDKGGVFKTSCAANLSELYANAGYSVLAVDFDPQGNLGEDLGYTSASDNGASLRDALITGTQLHPVENVRPGLDVAAGGEGTYEAEGHLAQMVRDGQEEAAKTALARALAPIAGDYDLILIDSPPKIRLLQELALAASRWLLIPTKTDDSSRKGLQLMGARYQEALEFNPSLSLLGVILVGVGSRSRRIQDRARQAIADDFDDPGQILTATIRHVEAAAVDARRRGEVARELEQVVAAEAASKPWYEALRNKDTAGPRLAASAGSLAEDYQHLAEEILDRISQNEAETPEASRG